MKFDKNSLNLFYSKREWFIFLILFSSVFISNILFVFIKFQDFKKEELYQTSAVILNIYVKNKFNVLKLKDEDLTFFTSISKDKVFNKFDKINITIITNNIDFIGYVKGFYAQSFNLFLMHNHEIKFKEKAHLNVDSQHKNKTISELFDALFFAIPLGQKLRDMCAVFGISHLIAISGFHLGVMSILIYWILYYPYSYVHSKYFPYRNKKFDILIFSSLVLFSYVIFTDIVPSLLRAFVMFLFGICLLRTNIKLISYEVLLIITLFIVAFFPKYMFSLSLWFSLGAVFYIFLFLQYFKTIPKVGQFLLFNVWIYLSFNPVSHYFFGTTSLAQLTSPLFTIGFTIFYPIEALAHLFGFGGFLDGLIEFWLNLKMTSYELFTPLWFFYVYLILSFLSIWFRNIFIFLNVSFVLFNIYLYGF